MSYLNQCDFVFQPPRIDQELKMDDSSHASNANLSKGVSNIALVNQLNSNGECSWTASTSLQLNRLCEFLKDVYASIDEKTSKELTIKIRNECMATITNYEQRHDANGLEYMNEPKWVTARKKIGTRVRILLGLNKGMIGKIVEIKNHTIVVQVAGGKTIKYLPKHLTFLKEPYMDVNDEVVDDDDTWTQADIVSNDTDDTSTQTDTVSNDGDEW